MRTVRALALIPASMLLIGACSSDGGTSGAPSPTEIATTVAVDPGSPSTAGSSTVPSAGSSTVPSSADDATAATAVEGPVQIDVMVGIDSGPQRVEMVTLGSDVTLNITNPNADDEFHIHVIELEQSVAAGVTATFNFVADAPGAYEVESHVTNDVLLVIQVV